MIDLASQHNIQVVLLAVPEFGLFLNAAPMYQQLADSNKLAIENDALSDIIGTNTLKSDHIHPNAEGYKHLAKSIQSLLKQTGAIELK